MALVPADALDQSYDVCIIGAGPAGLACAFACHDQGLRVLVLEAGDKRPVPGSPDILAAEISDATAHDPVEIVAASALGGSSHWWGGRCLPLDPVDMQTWPIKWDDMLPWWRRAAEQIGAGALIELPPPGQFGALKQFHATTAESWAPDPNLSRRWRDRIRAPDGPKIVLGARVTGIRRESSRITGIDVLTQRGASAARARKFVLTCGGLGGLRLMLIAQRADPALFGGPDGPLGRGYMGHLTGSIADLVLTDEADAAAFSFHETSGGYFRRRRIMPYARTVTEEGIGNIAWWLDSPARGEASHGSATASARFLAASAVRVLAGKWQLGELPPLSPHFANVGKAPLSAAIGLTQTAWMLAASRVTQQRYLPRRFLSSGGGGWRMVYHAEQKTDPNNRISLSSQNDSVGLPKLRIDFQFGDQDIASVVRSHELLDKDLRAAGVGKVRWTYGEASYENVAAAARDGYHQLGGAAMSETSAGVVDTNCRAHGLENLFIASGSVFPTGGQANPTLTIVALALRVADHIATKRPEIIRVGEKTSELSVAA